MLWFLNFVGCSESDYHWWEVFYQAIVAFFFNNGVEVVLKMEPDVTNNFCFLKTVIFLASTSRYVINIPLVNVKVWFRERLKFWSRERLRFWSRERLRFWFSESRRHFYFLLEKLAITSKCLWSDGTQCSQLKCTCCGRELNFKMGGCHITSKRCCCVIKWYLV